MTPWRSREVTRACDLVGEGHLWGSMRERSGGCGGREKVWRFGGSAWDGRERAGEQAVEVLVGEVVGIEAIG